MKLIKSEDSGAIRFIGAGVIVALTAFSASLFPWQIKVVSGAIFIAYGVYLLISGNSGNSLLKWIVVGVVGFLFIGGLLMALR